MSTLYIMWWRDVRKYFRSKPQIAAAMGQPLLFLLILGFGFGPVFERLGRGSYIQFVSPGLIGMSILFMSMFTGIGLFWDRQFGFLKAMLVAPVPRRRLALGRTLGGATIATLQACILSIICLIVGFRPVNLAMLPLAFCFMVLIAMVFTSIGLAIGSILTDMQAIQLVMNFFVMPLFFLSGALFPLNNLPGWLSVATRFDPLTYGVDGLRATLIGVSHFGITTDLIVLGVIALVALRVEVRLFSRIQL